jgi:hypothetical protein
MVGSVSARDTHQTGKRIMRDWSENEYPDLVDPGMRSMMTSAQVDTFCIVWFDFENINWQGWTQIDNTAQVATFFHVDDFAGLGGGDYGGLIPAEGAQSWWCGARPNAADPYLCGWIYAPGYGNNWNQVLQFDSLAFTGFIDFTFKALIDSEQDWDYTYLQFDEGDGNWIEVDSYDGVQGGVYNYQFGFGLAATKIRFNFVADGAWSDQDGLYNTDGACIVDSLTIVDATGLKDYEDCEAAAVNDQQTDGDANLLYWTASTPPGYGSFSGLYSNLTEYDPCGDNFQTQIVFFVGSGQPSASYPGLFDTPFCTGPGGTEGPCQDEMVMSPVIQMDHYEPDCKANPGSQSTPIPAGSLPTLGGALLRFTTYRDLPLANLVFYTWSVRSLVAGCPGQWKDRNYVYYGPEQDYIFTTQDISDLVGADPIQVNVGCTDMCQYWYLEVGNCVNHTPSPYLDNVRVYRYETIGPQWSSRDLDLLQDEFPGNSGGIGIEAWVRADAANDLNPGDDPVIRPGDSAVVTCTSLIGGGIQYDGEGYPLMYAHVRAKYIGCASSCPGHVHPKAAYLYGPSLAGTYGRYDSDDGAQWTLIQLEEARVGEWPGTPAPDKYAFDLNDSLFTRGYMIEYYFSATDNNNNTSYYPRNAQTRANQTLGTGGVVYTGVSYIFEMTCLPLGCSDILFVDDFHGRGTFWGTVEQYFNSAILAALPSTEWPERYDVNNPSSLVSNGLQRSATSSVMTCYYRKVIWDAGNLDVGTIGDGDTEAGSDKTNDCQLLVDWMTLHPDSIAGAGLWVLGDDVAEDLNNLVSPQALALLTTWCGVLPFADPNWGSYYQLTGGFPVGTVTPPVTGTAGGIFNGDTWYAFGGCPIVNSFDCLTNAAGAVIAAEYPNYGPHTNIGAAIQNVTTNASNAPIRTMWFGHSFMYVRDTGPNSPPVRNTIVKKVVGWMNDPVNTDITQAEIPKAYKLNQNFPNPFNPSTTIKFDVRERGHVSLKIYNVAGQLVKTLVDKTMDARSYSVTWDGTNNHGAKVASGVYFYKMQSKSFNQTKKMVLLR